MRKRSSLTTGLVALALVLASCASAAPPETTTTTTTTSPFAPPITSTPPPAVQTETIAGVRVTFETQTNQFLNQHVRDAIEQAVSALPQHLADEIRAVPVYVVDAPDRCSASPLRRPAGCFTYTEDGTPLVELVLNNNGYQYSVVVHEFGHVIGSTIQDSGLQRQASFLNRFYLNPDTLEQPPTRYGRTNSHEDYAESFMLYVMQPDQLNACCSERFAYFEEVFTPPEPAAEPNALPVTTTTTRAP